MLTQIPAVHDKNFTQLPGQKELKRLLLLSSVVLSILLSSLYLLNPQGIQFLTLKSTDIILSTANLPHSEPEVVVVSIDEPSLAHYGQWPWPRYRVAQLLKKIRDGGASTIGLDILFPEPDRTSPVIWQQALKEDFGYMIDTSGIPEQILDHDIYLANILETGPYVLSYKFFFNQPEKTSSQQYLHPLSLSWKTSENAYGHPNVFHQATGVVNSHEKLAKVAANSGFLNGTPDIDGVLRRLPLIVEFEGNYFPSFALAILMQFKNHQLVSLRQDSLAITSLLLDELEIPTDEQGNFLLGPDRIGNTTSFSAADILGGTINLQSFKDKIVLVGSTASGLSQAYPTPYAKQAPLLDIHAHSIESLLTSVHTIRTPMFLILETLTSFFLTLCLALCIFYLPTLWSLGFCLLFACSSWLAAVIVYRNSGFLFSPLLPISSVILCTFILTILKYRFFQLRARKETEQALTLLQTSESSLQSILNAIPDIIYRLDANGIITFISPKIAHYATSPESMVGHSIFDFVAPEDIDKAIYALNERRMGERATYDLEVQLLFSKKSIKHQQNRRFFSVSAEGLYTNNIGSQNDFLGTQGIIRDITNRKLLENRLDQAKKMEVIGNLAAGIAHDLNNILSGLVSYPDLLLMEIPKDDPLHDKIKIIQKSGKKAAVIVQDLLTLARRGVEIADICNFNSIITDYLSSIEFQRLKSRYPHVTIHTKLSNNLLNIKGSAVHLSKVIMNIIHNSMEAMPTRGEINISTFNTYVDNYLDGYEHIPKGEYSCTIIEDDGVGIPVIDLKSIFEPFYSKKSMAKSGTGLGMTVIWATIKDHDGYLDIKSEEGVGTTLKIFLPTTREMAGADQRRIVLDDFLGSETILVVDDIPEQLNIAQNLLQKLGYTILTASSGEIAVEMIKEQPIDLIILDMIMPPGMDGLATYLAIAEICPGQKAIIASGFSESDRVKKLQELGVENYVQKPYSMETIAMAVRKELDR